MADPRCPLCDRPVPPGDDFTLRARSAVADKWANTTTVTTFYASGVHTACAEPLIAELRRRSGRDDWAVETSRTPGR